LEGVAVSGNVFLGPLAKDNGCLEELFAGILLEEGLVDNWAGEVVDHQLQNGLDLLLGVAGVVCKGSILIKLEQSKTIWDMVVTYPRATLENEAGEVHGGGSNLARGVRKEAVVQAANLQKILAKGAGLDVVVVGL
jgi:hypothetical protein